MFVTTAHAETELPTTPPPSSVRWILLPVGMENAW